MKMKLWSLFAIIAVSLGVIGCSAGSKDPMTDAGAEKQAENIGKQKRAIFLRSNSEYEGMSAEDKKTYVGFFQNEADARAYWDIMKNPPGGPRK